MATYVISDTHFGHRVIMPYRGMPEKEAEAFDKIMVHRWNGVVKPDDKVYHLGDVSFRNQEYTKEIVSQLNGHKILIMGNHDNRSLTWFKKVGFQEVYKHPQFIGWKSAYFGPDGVEEKEIHVVLSHHPTPYAIRQQFGREFINVCGHLHGNKALLPKWSVDVGVECTNYTPVDLSDIIHAIVEGDFEEDFTECTGIWAS
jgi:calcineurin-like phosphoesterase family protein